MNKDVKSVYDRYKNLLKNCDKTKVEANEDLLKNIAFTIVLLDRLTDKIEKTDVTENFEQGKQKFTRESPAVKSYNATIKSYIQMVKTFNDLIEDGTSKMPEGEKLLQYLASDSE